MLELFGLNDFEFIGIGIIAFLAFIFVPQEWRKDFNGEYGFFSFIPKFYLVVLPIAIMSAGVVIAMALPIAAIAGIFDKDFLWATIFTMYCIVILILGEGMNIKFFKMM